MLKYKFKSAKLFSSLHLINIQAMISRTKAKLIRSMNRKKIRDREGVFLVEGSKMVRELLQQQEEAPMKVLEILATGDWLSEHDGLLVRKDIICTRAEEDEIRKLTHMINPQPVMALVRMPEVDPDLSLLAKECILGFESIRDPGNLGTIIRTAEWFGIRHIICSPDSVDAFNPKVVQSSMGAIFRVRVHYLELHTLISDPAFGRKPVYGTFLEGENLYETRLGKDPLILFGNESRGLTAGLAKDVHRKITIPSFAGGTGSESLNLASSVAVICSELRRPCGP